MHYSRDFKRGQLRYLIVLPLLISGCASVDASRLRQMSRVELVQTFESCVGPIDLARWTFRR